MKRGCVPDWNEPVWLTNSVAGSQLAARKVPDACLMLARVLLRSAVATALATAWIGVPISSASASQSTAILSVMGPVIRGDAPDPSILVVGHTYYSFTTDSGVNNVPVYESTDLVHWQLVGDAMPVLPSWAEVGLSWSPSVTFAPGGGYRLFYDAYNGGSGMECIGRATAASPLGPFVDTSSTPFLCQPDFGGSIDASVFHQDGGDVLVWKSDRIAGIWAQSLGSDDARVVGVRHLLLTPSASWEGGVIEGPAMLQIGSTITLWFSAGAWSGSSYSIGMVRCDSPLGPCDAKSAVQELKSRRALIGPGGPTFFDRHGTAEMAFSAWVGNGREMYLASVGSDGQAVASSARSTTLTLPRRAATVSSARASG